MLFVSGSLRAPHDRGLAHSLQAITGVPDLIADMSDCVPCGLHPCQASTAHGQRVTDRQTVCDHCRRSYCLRVLTVWTHYCDRLVALRRYNKKVATILLVEDERELNALIRKHLEDEGHRVVQAFDGPSGLLSATQEHPDLVILDWMLPRLDGLEVCRRLRRESIVPILMLTGRAEEIDRVLGLEVGADDYLTKPFSIRELLARVRAIFRRIELQGQSASADASPPLLEEGSLRVDVGEHTASVDGQPLELTPKEFDLLVILVQNPGRAFARDYLLDKVWGYEYGGLDTRTVDTHVLRLRKKLGGVGDRIETVWGVGYRFARASQPLRAMAKEG
jgi:DNA-binding response OmpR family regulator